MAQQSIECAESPLDIAAAEVAVGLSYPIRVAILRLLVDRGELCSCEIEPCFDVDPSGISRHLTALRHAGLIVSRRDGVRILHRLASQHVADLLAVADSVAAGGDAPRSPQRPAQKVEPRPEVQRRVRSEKR